MTHHITDSESDSGPARMERPISAEIPKKLKS